MRTHKKTFAKGILPILVAGVLLLTWPSTGYSGEWEPQITGSVKGTIEIKIQNMQFTNPEAGEITDHLLVIPEGMTVKWTNMDPLTTVNGAEGLMPHGIQISDETEEVFVASSLLTEGQNSFSYTFEEAGIYDYGCFVHVFLKGKIVVISMSYGS